MEENLSDVKRSSGNVKFSGKGKVIRDCQCALVKILVLFLSVFYAVLFWRSNFVNPICCRIFWLVMVARVIVDQ